MKTQGKKILVVGGAGYVGCALVPKLLDKGYDVTVLDKLIYGDFGLENLKDRITLITGDALQPPENLMRGFYGVIHLAGLATQSVASYHSPRYTDMANHRTTEILARMAKAEKIERFVFASSCSLYCSYQQRENESAKVYGEDEFAPVCAPYAFSKRAAEEVLLELADQSFRPVIFRKGTLFGFSPKMRYDLVINAFTKDAFRNKIITVNAGGAVVRPMTDLQTAVAAYIAALELPLDRIGGQIFNVVDFNCRLSDLAGDFTEVVRQIRGHEIQVDTRPFEPVLNYLASNAKFREVFKIEPVRDLKSAVEEIWLKLEQGDDPQNPKYYVDRWYMDLFSSNPRLFQPTEREREQI